MLENFDPNTIEDPMVRQIVLYLMNRVESQQSELQEKDEKIQRLLDEISRLKGEQGKPKIKANKPAAPQLSSEKERRESKPHQKESKQSKIRIDQVKVLKVDKGRLPQDAKLKGYVSVITQDIEFRTKNSEFGHPRNITLRAKSRRI